MPASSSRYKPSTAAAPANTAARPLWLRRSVGLLVLLALGILPLLAWWQGEPFWLDVATRLVILAIAAASLNLLLGYAGLASFGHAAFLGIGAYAVGVPAYHATYGGAEWLASYSGFFQFALAIGVASLFALITGAICLRTRGAHFIMITMAFSQMIYYGLVSLEEYGADDGLSIDLRSEFPGVDFDDPLQLFGWCYGSLLVVLWLIDRIVKSRFGMVLEATRQNEQRMQALGVDAWRYRLVAYVIAGAICGYAGALMANFSVFISPSIIEWSRSGELMFMVILGGAAWVFGPVVGAALFIVLEHFLSQWTVFWHLPFGLLLILAALFLQGGIGGMLAGKAFRRGGFQDHNH